ncbi:MAG: hypothetical protein RL417_1450, partial [Pseudomonadota bacterium]
TPYQQEVRRYAEEQKQLAVAQPSGSLQSAVSAPSAAPQAPGVVSPSSLIPPTPEEIRQGGSLSIESDLVNTSISLIGGRLEHYTLKKYRDDLASNDRYDLIGVAPGVPLPIGVYSPTENDVQVRYTVESTSRGAPAANGSYSVQQGEGELAITLRGTLPSGIGIRKTYRFASDSYLFNLEVSLDQPVAAGAPISIEWTHGVPPHAEHVRNDTPWFSSLNAADSVSHLYDPALSVQELGAMQWVAYSERYFLAALIPTTGPAPASVSRDVSGLNYAVRAVGTPTGASMRVFIGPKDDRILERHGFDLDRAIDLGTFAFLAHPLLALLRAFNDLLGNYGLAIILLTLFIKLLFLPLTKASFDSMQKMAQIQPEMKALRERITDPTQLNQELMALYKRRGVNPMGGCLPVLIQIPVFIGLYNALLNSIELRHAPFALWINDLSAPEHLYVFGIGIPVMVLLMGASMFYQQMTTPTAMDPQQKKIFMMLPVIFTISFIIFPFPAGLVLYWLVNNIISITQQVYLRSELNVSPVKATVLASLAIFSFGFVLTLI